ncbi:hypothetical protein QR680_017883 [Steinernema hermaphroditum]|uniref:Nuclear receptor domain-containing protein n=1 Tax=Steinernema hermaphroditum TaxID=289476 RepID=A0AA39LPX4_9BILA|nr:hypothetical protein QR680_017883 [Steinernema hermaphroditum]
MTAPRADMKVKPPTTCLVCGDSANCCHYGVPSCDTCKSFFRRYVLGTKRKSCSKGNACNIHHEVKMCAHCRFQKCLILGMRPEAVKSASCKNIPMKTLISKQNNLGIDLAGITFIEARMKKLLFSTYFPYSTTKSVRDFLKEECSLSQVDKYGYVTFWKKPPPQFVFSGNSTKEGYKMWGFVKAILMIEFYKTFEFFRNLSESDQLALTRATVVPMVMFYKACNSYFRGNRERLIDPDGTVPYQGLLADSPMVSKVRHSHVLSACVKNKITPEKAALLKTIIALNSAAPNLSEGAREVIEEERLKYVKALMKIVQLESDSVEWLPRFQRLYDMIHLNMTDTQNMMHFFMLELLPLLSKGFGVAQIWWEIHAVNTSPSLL